MEEGEAFSGPDEFQDRPVRPLPPFLFPGWEIGPVAHDDVIFLEERIGAERWIGENVSGKLSALFEHLFERWRGELQSWLFFPLSISARS